MKDLWCFLRPVFGREGFCCWAKVASKGLAGCLGLVLLLGLGSPSAYAQAGYLELEQGQVQVTRSPWPEFFGLPKTKVELQWQDRVHCGKASRVRLFLPEGLEVQLGAETFVQLNQTLTRPVLLQSWGLAEYRGSAVQVQTINGLVLGQGSRFWVEANGPVTRVFVGQGDLQLSFLAFPQDSVSLKAGEWAELNSEKPLPGPQPMPAGWEKRLEQGEQNLPGPGQPGRARPKRAGAEPLDRGPSD